jgi:hypothetical protein
MEATGILAPVWWWRRCWWWWPGTESCDDMHVDEQEKAESLHDCGEERERETGQDRRRENCTNMV